MQEEEDKMSEILKIKDLSYSYKDGDHERVIFDHTSLAFEEGKFYAITGESGSGKTTFLYAIGGLDSQYQGEILYKDQEIKKIGLDEYRRNKVSMVYQNFNLIPYLSALQNIYVAVDITDNVGKITKKEALEILAELNIDPVKAARRSSSLSGGEQQRAAIARALAVDSPIIIADEPTGNLDREAGEQAVEVFQKLAHEKNKCIIMVTHNLQIAEKTDVQYQINQQTHQLECMK